MSIFKTQNIFSKLFLWIIKSSVSLPEKRTWLMLNKFINDLPSKATSRKYQTVHTDSCIYADVLKPPMLYMTDTVRYYEVPFASVSITSNTILCETF